MKSLKQIVEMAGPGKRGPMTKAEKEAKVEADNKTAADKEKREKEWADHKKKYENDYAPAHRKEFEHQAHEHLSKHGFEKVIDSHKKAVYIKTSPEHDLVHMVSLDKPHKSKYGINEYHKLNYSNSNGTSSMNHPSYKPNMMMDHEKDAREKHEAIHTITHHLNRVD